MDVNQVIQLLVSLATLATLVWGLVRMFANTREARTSRGKSIAASQNAETASQNAERAAVQAAEHTETTRADVNAMAENVQKVELATNSMKDALIAATAKASFAAGEKSEREKKATPAPPRQAAKTTIGKPVAGIKGRR